MNKKTTILLLAALVLIFTASPRQFITDTTLANYWPNRGMHICGISVYFNNVGGANPYANIKWATRPDDGDIWIIRCSGPKNPVTGNYARFTTLKARQSSALDASMLDQIKVVPNPYLVRANWDVSKDYPNIYFTHLPSKCTVRIYTLGGDLIRVLHHETEIAEYGRPDISNNGAEKWNVRTKYDKRPASGIYVFQVDAPGIGTKIGKFAIIK